MWKSSVVKYIRFFESENVKLSYLIRQYRYYASDLINQSACLNDKRLPYQHVPFFVYFPIVQIRKLKKNTHVSKIQILIRMLTFSLFLFSANLDFQGCINVGRSKKLPNSDVFYITSNELLDKVGSFDRFLLASIFYSVPKGVITFRRRAMPQQMVPKWSESTKGLAPMHLTTGKKDRRCRLCFTSKHINLSTSSSAVLSFQVDFANKFIVSLLKFR